MMGLFGPTQSGTLLQNPARLAAFPKHFTPICHGLSLSPGAQILEDGQSRNMDQKLLKISSPALGA